MPPKHKRKTDPEQLDGWPPPYRGLADRARAVRCIANHPELVKTAMNELIAEIEFREWMEGNRTQ